MNTDERGHAATLQLCTFATLLLAALIRFWHLGYHSIWFDEAVSLQWAGSDPSYTWQTTFQLASNPCNRPSHRFADWSVCRPLSSPSLV